MDLKCRPMVPSPPVRAEQHQRSPRELKSLRSHEQMASIRHWCMETGGKDPQNPAERSRVIMTTDSLCSRACLQVRIVGRGEGATRVLNH